MPALRLGLGGPFATRLNPLDVLWLQFGFNPTPARDHETNRSASGGRGTVPVMIIMLKIKQSVNEISTGTAMFNMWEINMMEIIGDA